MAEYRDALHDDAARYRTANADFLSAGDDTALRTLQGVEGSVGLLSAQIEAGWDRLESERRTADQALNAAMVGANAHRPRGMNTMLAGIGMFFTPLPDVSAADIGTLSAKQLAAWLLIDGHQERLRAILAGMQDDPVWVSQWWQGLGQAISPGGSVVIGEKQMLLIAALPAMIGNLNGVTNVARDAANRRYLIQSRQALLKEIEDLRHSPVLWLFPRVVEAKQRELAAINGVFNILYNAHGSPKQFTPVRQLIRYDPQAPGAAISIGDLDAAAYATFQVPGLNTGLSR